MAAPLCNAAAMSTVTVPPLGELQQADFDDWHRSEPIAVPVLDGESCKFVVEGIEKDDRPADFSVAIENFLAASPEILEAVKDDLFAYYTDYAAAVGIEDWDDFEPIESADDVWSRVDLGDEPHVVRESSNGKIYISLECNCDWEEEHGLQLVFEEGRRVSKLGEYDGHNRHWVDGGHSDEVYPRHQ